MKLIKQKYFWFIGIIALFTLYAFSDSTYFKLSRNFELFVNLYKEINRSYVDDVQPAGLMRNAIESTLKKLDPYTNFYSEAVIEDSRLQRAGGQGDIGITLIEKDKHFYIETVLTDQPADKAGLRPGDEIVSIEGKTLQDKTLEDVNLAIKGQPQTVLKIQVQAYKSNQPKAYEILREEITPESVTYSQMVNDTVAYISLSSFTQNCGEFVAKEYEKLQKDNPNLKYLVFDLRYNGGGLLKEAITVSNIFVNKNVAVVSTRGKIEEWNKTYTTNADPLALDIPLVVLINSRSASASEIVSGVMQDLDRGVIVGQRSYGKGLVQQTREIGETGYKAMLKLTVAKYYIPSGRCVQAVDYSGRYTDAGAHEIPDSLRSAFKTANGRTVYDNSGVTPDIFIENLQNQSLVQQLQKELVLFNFVNEYVANHENIAPAESFQFTDADFKQFINFAQQQHFQFYTQTDSLVSLLDTVATYETYYPSVSKNLDNLREKLKTLHGKEIQKYEPMLRNMLKESIIERYYGQSSKLATGIQDDAYIQEAVKLFADMPRYNKILNKK
ncbi:MAG: S41 family peptidase [Chitinophagales bacterium]|nr:PDZ domain-containing protein [Bacteroidota bacterium]MCB9042438.1 PDZ domain-containing protein [Chitinophagales bacterium]